MDSGLNTAIKKRVDKAISLKVSAGLIAASLQIQDLEGYIEPILNGARSACTRDGIIRCWNKVGLWPRRSTDEFMASLEERKIFEAEDKAAQRVLQTGGLEPPTLEGFIQMMENRRREAAEITSQDSVELRAKAATWEYTLQVPELVLSPVKKRKPVHGVGPAKYQGHYHPVNIGPRAEALRRGLAEEANQKVKVRMKRQAIVCHLM